MTREEFAAKIRWPFIIWTIGFVNVVAMLPQLLQLIRTETTDGLSVWMFVIYFVIQVCFAIEGYLKRSNVLAVCMALSALVTAAVITLIGYFRYAA